MTKFHGSLKILFLAYLTVVFAPTPVLAYDSSILGSRYRSAKAAGMGEQLFQFANEGGAGLFYNPSTISNFGSDLTTEPINVSFYGNDGFFNLNGLGIQNTFQLDTQASTLMDHPGIYVSSGWAYL
ncbi:MAG: hypothetical protein ABIQ95_13495, partial [Bdellovibrionia bacterium]